MNRLITILANSQVYFVSLTKNIHIHCNEIGEVKIYQYEAVVIVLFVANGLLMPFFYTKDTPDYQK